MRKNALVKNALVLFSAALACAALLAASFLRAESLANAPVARISAAPEAATAAANKTTQVRGFSMQLFQQGKDQYIKAIDEMADLGCTWVNLSFSARQNDVHSQSIAIKWDTVPSEEDVREIILHAKKRGMGVMFMPIVLLSNSGSKDWRGVIDPPSWNDWFASYTFYITHMARIAQDCGVDIFCVGSELLSTEPLRQQWIDAIAQIRSVYHGKLTYSANWDHYEVVSFWDQLDYIGMNNYNELGKQGTPVTDLDKAWQPIKKKILDFAAKENKPFMFTEVGWHNLDNTLKEPWNYVATGSIDYNEQLHAYQSFVDTWQNVPTDQFMGAFIWEWWPGAKYGDKGSYSLQGAPALDVVKKWMSTH